MNGKGSDSRIMLERRNLTRTLLQTLTVILLTVTGCTLVSAQEDPIAKELLGVWQEKDGTAVYTFGRDHEFEYSYDETAISKGKAQEPPGTAPQKGAWRFGPEVCWLGQTTGNLMIHLGTERCCFIAHLLGKNLVLMPLAPGNGFCSDRVLIKKLHRQGK